MLKPYVQGSHLKKPTGQTVCVCGEGYGSDYDGLCKFCREQLVRRAVAKSVNVRHRGDGMSVDQYRVAIGEVKRKDVYI